MIETKKLTKKFGKNIALNNLDFNVEKGEIFCFLGANGAGKTTTIATSQRASSRWRSDSRTAGSTAKLRTSLQASNQWATGGYAFTVGTRVMGGEYKVNREITCETFYRSH